MARAQPNRCCCDGPSPIRFGLVERQSLRAYSRLAVAFSRPCRTVVEINLVVPASPSSDKTRRRRQVVLGPLFLSRSTTVWPNKISKISEPHALGYARVSKAAPRFEARLWSAGLGPLMASSHSTPSWFEATVGAQPQARRHARLFGPRRQAERKHAAPRYSGNSVGRTRRPGCEDEINDAVLLAVFAKVTLIERVAWGNHHRILHGQ